MVGGKDQEAFRYALSQVSRFVYQNGFSLAIISLLWFLASLSLVMIGPATLAAYVAIQDLRSDQNRVDRAHVLTVLRHNGVASAMFSGVPVALGAVAVTYATAALERGSVLGEGIALVAAYAAVYVSLALMPTFAKLAGSEDAVDALRYGLKWLIRHPTPALAMGLMTLVVLSVTVLLTIAFVLVFPGLAFSIQLTIIDEVEEHSSRTSSVEMASNSLNS
ncbi:hypothetical protein [Halococcus salsus]|uniref:hypothetical protein n=1 Tax=Halococcus salsus TaxID=2162894 RepID=UPI0013587894|nr:hypothetical protein [Halococcus salsus]